MAMITLTSLLFSSCAAPEGGNAGNRAANNTAVNSANNAAGTPASAAAIETEIKKLANDGVSAILKNDTAALDKLWADNYEFIAQDGTVQTKAQRLDGLKSGQSKLESLSYDEMTVRSNPEGTGAILVGRATVKGTNMGKPVDGRMRFTQVWSKTKDGWRAVHGQVSPITATSADDKKMADTSTTANTSKPPASPANK